MGGQIHRAKTAAARYFSRTLSIGAAITNLKHFPNKSDLPPQHSLLTHRVRDLHLLHTYTERRGKRGLTL